MESYYERLKKIFETGGFTVDGPDQLLASMEIDSLEEVDLELAIDQEFGFYPPPDLMEKCKTVGELAEALLMENQKS